MNNERKSTFLAVTEIEIFSDGLPFYKCKQGTKFNLPIGTFDIRGIFEEQEKFEYKKIMMFPEAWLVKPKKFSIVYVDNYPNKCSIFLDSGKVIADSNFAKIQKFVFLFVLCHEFGHFYFKGNGDISELMCDKFARQAMLFLGYNPSQIDLAIQITLNNSELSKQRKKVSFNQLKK